MAVLATLPAASPIALLAVSAPVWLTAMAMFGSGSAAGHLRRALVHDHQCEVPEDALSRVSSYDWFGFLAFAPLGPLAAGPVPDVVGSREALAGCAAVIAVATCTAPLSPQVRRLTTTPRQGDTTCRKRDLLRRAVC
ncbi:hypothetical protein ABZZ79_33945 [Streptomyces sp. NPDC006458]|uniref:hypothetical protein n=1 Tax=Streptomyces sp. NPDC006458 TaxID=3154302 RepID=UPI00339E2965